MSWLRGILLIAGLTAMAGSSGCCLFTSCAGGNLGCGTMAPGCGLESYYQGGCSDGGCEGCGDGPAVPCQGQARVGLGLGCIGKALGLGSGCNGCGETYYHGWVNDPPCCDPCDGNGNWIGPQGGCASGSCGAGACGGGCGLLGNQMVDPSCGSAGVVAPTCGAAGCGTNACGQRRTGFRLPGRAIYAVWTGMGGLVHELHRGLLPCGDACNFCATPNCNDCSLSHSVPLTHSAPTPTYAAGTPHNSTSHHYVSTLPITPPSIPHDVVNREMQMNHGRPPHPVVSDRFHNLRR